LARYGLTGHYVPLHVRPADLAATLDLLPRLGFVGVNVTLPHKEAVLKFAQTVTPLAARIGSANTLTFGPDGIHADNTDAHGFTWNILDSLPHWSPRQVALIGAGGASRAVIVALQDRGAAQIRLTNRNPERARALADEFGLIAVPWAERAQMLAGCDTLINATTQGMTGQPPLDLPLDDLPKTALVTDLIYTPLETPLLTQARQRGNPIIDGLGMLLHQAAPGFQRWFGQPPQVDAALRAAVLA
jgi:shikimate dehydrogenase